MLNRSACQMLLTRESAYNTNTPYCKKVFYILHSRDKERKKESVVNKWALFCFCGFCTSTGWVHAVYSARTLSTYAARILKVARFLPACGTRQK